MAQVILHNIRSVHNVGSIFRTADGLGVEKLHLTGYTPAPTDRFGRKRKKFQKVALGAEDAVTWRVSDSIEDLISRLKEGGMEIVACEPKSSAVPLSECNPSSNTCLVFGHEVDGLDQDIINLCDKTVKIPMRGKKSSLNVAVAFGIITRDVIDKNS